LLKSLIHKIKEQKNSRIFSQELIDEIENKMSKIKKNKKQTNNKARNFRTKNISHMYIFLKDLLEISRIR